MWRALSVALLTAPFVQAADLVVERLPIAGQPVQEIFAIEREPGGALWIGTSDGLYRYDGQRFTRVGAESDGLRSQNAGLLALDPDGSLWVGTWGGGLHRVDLASRRVERIELPADKIQSAIFDAAGTLYVGTAEHGLFRRSSPVAFEHVQASGQWRIWDLCQQGSVIYLALDGGLARLEGEDWQFWSAETGNPHGFDHRQLRAVHCTEAGPWVATRGGLGQFDPRTERWTRVTDALGAVPNRLIAEGEQLWLLATAGLMRYDLKRGDFAELGESRRILTHLDLRDALIAEPGRLWLASRNGGLQSLNLQRRVERSLVNELQQATGSAEAPVVNTLLDLPEVTLIGTSEGLLRLDRAGIRRYSEDPRLQRPIRALKASPDSLLVLADQLLELHGAAVTDHSPAILAGGLGLLSITDMQPLPEGGLLLSAGYGPLRRLVEGRLEQVSAPALSQIPHEQANQLLQTSDGLWVSTFAGAVYVREAQTSQWSRVPLQVDGQDYTAKQLIGNSDGRHWLTTDRGLLRYSPEAGRFQAVPLLVGAPSLYAAAQDAHGVLWVGLPGQLLAIDSEDRQTLQRIRGTLLPQAMLMSRNAELLIGSREGLQGIRSEARPPPAAPPVEISGALVNEVAVPHAALSALLLPADTRLFELLLATPALWPGEPRQLSYRIPTLETPWLALDDPSRVQLGGLPPGRHRIELAAATTPGRFGPTTVVDVAVLPPWFRDPRWLLMLATSLGLVLFAWFRWRMASLTAQRERLQALVEQRTRELAGKQQQLIVADKMAALGMLTAGMAHEINNPVSFSYAAAQNLRQGLQDFAVFLHELAGADADREVLDAIDQRLGALDAQVRLSLEGSERIQAIVRDLKLISRLDQAQRKIADLEEGLRATLRLVETHYHKRVQILTDFCGAASIECWPAQMNQVFMNLVVNACQALIGQGRDHPGTLTIRSRRSSDALTLEFVDDGPGIDPALHQRIFEPLFTTSGEQGLGLGLSISRDIVERHGGSLTVTSALGHGASFVIRLPLAAHSTDGSPS